MSRRALALACIITLGIVGFGVFVRASRRQALRAKGETASAVAAPAPVTRAERASSPSPTTRMASAPVANPETPEARPSPILSEPAPTPAIPVITPAQVQKTTATLALAPAEQGEPYSLSLLILDDRGSLLPNADIALVYGSGDVSNRVRARSGEDGTWHSPMSRLPAISTLTVSAPGFAPFRQDNLSIPAETLVVQLRRAPAVEGVVLGPDGQPYAGEFTALLLTPPRTSQALPANEINLSTGRPSLAASTRFAHTQGRFRFESLEAGSYAVAVWTDEGLGGAAPWFDLGDYGAAAPLTLTLGADLKIVGKVFLLNADGSQEPPAAAEVAATNWAAILGQAGMPLVSAATDEAGRYEIAGLPGGAYELTVTPESADVGAARRSDVFLLPGSQTEVDFALPAQTLTLTGQARDEPDSPLAGAPVLLLRSAPSPLQRQATTDAAGAFEFTGLAAGAYAVGIAHPADPSWQKLYAVEVRDGAPNRVALRFHPRTRVSGRLLRGGVPLPGETIEFRFITDSDGQAMAGGPIEVASDKASGEYSADLEPGLYSVSAAGAPPLPVDVPAPSGAVHLLDIGLTP
ncbi:MAG: carboxypeptidase-like regulatory domain-containing protein [Candidatus Sumerlaeota bacterium]|nr:carboxypeptidase-like regulatory domain-containing protein [Candidatus Sumerlaeota bacterium]